MCTTVANYQPLGLSSICAAEAFQTTGRKDPEGGWLGGLSQWCNAGRSDAGGVAANNLARRACCGEDPCKLLPLGNGGPTELSYATSLQRHFLGRLNWKPRFVIDTGRNGNREQRSRCSSWCNVRGAGAGHVATLNTGATDVVDAFWWLKTPGESDGCTERLPGGGRCPRFDEACQGDDAIGGRAYEPRAPEAGDWFAFQALQLARNANLHLEADGALDPLFGVIDRPPRPPKPPPPSPPLPPPPHPLFSPPPPPPPPGLRLAAIARAKAKADVKAAQALQQAAHADAVHGSGIRDDDEAANESASKGELGPEEGHLKPSPTEQLIRNGTTIASMLTVAKEPSPPAPAVPFFVTFLRYFAATLIMLTIAGTLVARRVPLNKRAADLLTSFAQYLPVATAEDDEEHQRGCPTLSRDGEVFEQIRERTARSAVDGRANPCSQTEALRAKRCPSGGPAGRSDSQSDISRSAKAAPRRDSQRPAYHGLALAMD